MKWLIITFAMLALCAVCLLLWRFADTRAERRVWASLLQQAGPAGPAFDPATIEALPEPARRYFRYTIAAGTPLVTAVEIEMTGQLGLGSKMEPGYRAMTARQILTPPHGLVWRVNLGPISGSDAATPETSWTRFWLLNLIPVARVSANADHHRSAFGRVVSEGAFWVPASLLPGSNVIWTSVSDTVARASVSYGAYSQTVDLTIDDDGRPGRVVIQRWSNENAEHVYREQAFGGYLSDFREIGGYRLPMTVEGGNLIGTEEYFPFYKAQVTAVSFPQLSGETP